MFTKTIREKWRFLSIMTLIAVLAQWMYISLFPTFANQSEEFEKLLAQFPQELWEMFGLQDGIASMSTLERFISVEMFSLLWPIMAIILFVNLGTNAIAHEIEHGTLEIVLSLPLSRLKVFFGKYLAGAAMLVVFSLASTYSVIFWARIFHISYQTEVYHKLALVAILFTMAGYSLAILCSTLFEKGRAMLYAAGLFFVMYVINIVSSLKDSLENLQYISFFHYLDMPGVLSSNSVEYLSIGVFFGTAVVATVCAAVYFQKRDIAL